ncbi:hypothetical protein S245_053046, partial [Arachis hypogaea]
SNTDSNIELPVAAAATATASAVVATTAAVSKQYEQGSRSDGHMDGTGYEPKGSGDDDVAEYDIPLEEIIGLGSYGEVYRGEWRGTVSFIPTQAYIPYPSYNSNCIFNKHYK